MNDERVRLPLLDDVPDVKGRRLFRQRLQGQGIVLAVQIRGNAGNDLEHMGIFKGNVLVEIRDEQHRAACLPGKILGPRVGAVAETIRNFPYRRLGLVGDGVAVVQRLGNRGNGYPRLLCHVINRHRHESVPPVLHTPMHRLWHDCRLFSRAICLSAVREWVRRPDSW